MSSLWYIDSALHDDLSMLLVEVIVVAGWVIVIVMARCVIVVSR